MAQEGLFFTGTVLKNNRNLLQEEAARQQLAMQRERLELQKQAAADRRKEARRKNQPKPLSFDSSTMGPEMGRIFQSDVLNYQKDLANMSEGIINQDSEAINQRYDSESALKTEQVVFNEVWKEVSANRELARGNNRDSLGTNEEGGYVFEDNYNSFLNAVNEGISPSEALEMFPISQGAINRTPYKNPINALYDVKGSKMTTITNADGSQYKTLGDISKESEDVVAGLTPDKNGNWSNPAYEKIYLGKEGSIEVEGVEGNMSYPAAFAYETRGIDIAQTNAQGEVSTTFTDKLDPKNPDTYDPELANEYIQFIKDKSEEKAKRNYPNQLIKAKTESTDDDTGLSADASKVLLGESDNTKSFGEANIKFSPNQYDDLTNEDITVSLSPEALIQEQGAEKLEEFNTALQVWNSEKTGADAQGNIIYTGITTSNVPVAAVEFSGQMYLIPLASLSSSVKKKIKTAGGTSLDLFKIAEGEVATTTQGVGSKYNK